MRYIFPFMSVVVFFFFFCYVCLCCHSTVALRQDFTHAKARHGLEQSDVLQPWN